MDECCGRVAWVEWWWWWVLLRKGRWWVLWENGSGWFGYVVGVCSSNARRFSFSSALTWEKDDVGSVCCLLVKSRQVKSGVRLVHWQISGLCRFSDLRLIRFQKQTIRNHMLEDNVN